MADLQGLIDRRCLNHPLREAAARCPGCRGFFCRECVTEHGERVMCAACIAGLVRAGAVGKRRRRAAVGSAARVLSGVMVAWFFFYAVGQALLALPDTFHQAARPPAADSED